MIVVIVMVEILNVGICDCMSATKCICYVVYLVLFCVHAGDRIARCCVIS